MHCRPVSFLWRYLHKVIDWQPSLMFYVLFNLYLIRWSRWDLKPLFKKYLAKMYLYMREFTQHTFYKAQGLWIKWRGKPTFLSSVWGRVFPRGTCDYCGIVTLHYHTIQISDAEELRRAAHIVKQVSLDLSHVRGAFVEPWESFVFCWNINKGNRPWKSTCDRFVSEIVCVHNPKASFGRVLGILTLDLLLCLCRENMVTNLDNSVCVRRWVESTCLRMSWNVCLWLISYYILWSIIVQ